ncbi:unnamed protein product [Rotaria magnacalcarata]|uniref:NAD(P)(+)--arginine ADP-ribosyltransferase n=1 Tax=Rotaria magnacalcarata TaxID=392030 RepID=A0A815MWQ2_9BILA|nr:unnamed protein product [Rotaria magnacalcarata]CAF4126951.1 unnamed protein product [Rotaria magnacalcarata]
MDANDVSNKQNKLFQYIQPRIIDQFIIIWFDADFPSGNQTIKHLLDQLQRISNEIETFSDVNKCVDFITDVVDKKILLIISPVAGQLLLPFIEPVSELYSIYMFSSQHTSDDQWAFKQNKVKGIFFEVESICGALKRDLCQLINDAALFSIVSTKCAPNFEQLDQSFMYTTLLKEAILEIEHDSKARERFTRFCLGRVFDEPLQPKKIYEFQRCYDEHTPIWWYTKECFVYSQLNQALRTQDTEFMIEMGFFLRDLHRDIERKYSETDKTTKKYVYRGQGLSVADFNKIKERKDCLLSFNNFLSTSTDREVALLLAESNLQKSNNVGILFQMEIDPNVSSTHYALIDDESAFVEEQEVLFSMPSVFRIGEIIEIQDRLWEVNLKFTSDDDSELTSLTNYIRNEMKEVSGWYCIANLMIRMGKYEKGIEIFNNLFSANVHDNDIEGQSLNLVLDLNMATTELLLGKYSSSLKQLQSLLEKLRDMLPPDHLLFSKIYNTFGLVQRNIGYYKTSLSYLEMSLQIQLRSSATDHDNLSITYNNVAMTYHMMGDNIMALKSYEEALAIQRKSLPTNHPSLGYTYANIGLAYQSMGNNVSAISYLERALEILQKTIPPDHPDFATIHTDIGMVQTCVSNYQKAHEYFEEALKIQQKSLPANHPNLGIVHSNIGIVYQFTGKPSDALTSYKKAHRIFQKSFPEDHPLLTVNDSYIGAVYTMMGNYSKALVHFEKALANQERAVNPNHQHLTITYNGLGVLYQAMGNFPNSKLYYEKALELGRKYLPPNHAILSRICNNLGMLSLLMGDYITGCSAMSKMIEIEQKSHSAHQNHSSLAMGTDTSNSLRQSMNSYSEAMAQLGSTFEDMQRFVSSVQRVEDSTEEDLDRAHSLLKRMTSVVPNLDRVWQDHRELLSTNPSTLLGITINPAEQNQTLDYGSNVLECLKKQLSSLPNMGSADAEEIHSVLDNMSSSDATRENFRDMFQGLDKLWELYRKSLPSDNPTLAILYNNYGGQNCSMDNHSLGLLCYEKALDNILNHLPNNYQLLAKTYSNMATELDHLERLAEAIDYAEKAIQTAESAFGMRHEETIFYQNQLQQLQRKGRFIYENI